MEKTPRHIPVGRILLGLIASAIFYKVFLREPYVPPPEPARIALPPRDEHRYDPSTVDLHIGSRRFKVGVDYIMMTPFVGGNFTLEAVWPTMRTVDEEVEVYGAKVDGRPGVRVSDTVEIEFSKVPDPAVYKDAFRAFVQARVPSDKSETEVLGDLGLYVRRYDGFDRYWAMDPAVVTPYQKVPYTFSCSNGFEGKEPTRETCHGSFQLNREVSVRIRFNKIYLHDWKNIYFQVLEFIQSIEEPQ